MSIYCPYPHLSTYCFALAFIVTFKFTFAYSLCVHIIICLNLHKESPPKFAHVSTGTSSTVHHPVPTVSPTTAHHRPSSQLNAALLLREHERRPDGDDFAQEWLRGRGCGCDSGGIGGRRAAVPVAITITIIIIYIYIGDRRRCCRTVTTAIDGRTRQHGRRYREGRRRLLLLLLMNMWMHIQRLLLLVMVMVVEVVYRQRGRRGRYSWMRE